MYVSTYLYPSIYIYLSIYPSIYQSIYLSIYLSKNKDEYLGTLRPPGVVLAVHTMTHS
jgi:hypothetical protein